jgi:hypothetical protein
MVMGSGSIGHFWHERLNVQFKRFPEAGATFTVTLRTAEPRALDDADAVAARARARSHTLPMEG